MNKEDFSKEFFQKVWGESGYYEDFSYGAGIKKVISETIIPHSNIMHNALEIGCGGGAFTKHLVNCFGYVFALDVIKKPDQFSGLKNLTFIELPNQTFKCLGINDNSIDFAFSYNVFCHLSNQALTSYIADVNRVLKSGSYFIFMLSNYANIQTKQASDKFGHLLPMGHFYQDDRTIDVIVGNGWEIISRNIIPEHRDIIVKLRKI